MKLLDVTRRAGRSLGESKVRTLLTSLAIGVGAFTITLSLAAGQGGSDFANQIVSANTDVREVIVSQPQTQSDTPQKYRPGAATVSSTQTVVLNQTDINAIGRVAHVESVTPNYSPTVRYITRAGQDTYKVDSISSFSPSVTLKYAAGSVSNDLPNDGIIITEAYAKALGFQQPQDAIGKTVSVVADKLASPDPTHPISKTYLYTIKAVSSKSGFAFRSQGSLLVSATAAKELYTYVNQGTPAYGQFLLASVRVDDAKNADNVKQALVKEGYEAQTSKDILGSINTFINVLMAILIGFGLLAVLTSVFGIINTQYISVLERTQQIGLMKALGMRRRDVGRLFKLEAAWIGFLGGAIGAGLAVVVGTIANPHINDALDLDGVYLLQFNPMAVAGVVVGLMLVAVLAGILPARKASKLDPIEALRTE